jgi:hypothetical protein
MDSYFPQQNLSQGANATGFLREMMGQIIGNNNPRRSSGRYD